MSSSQDQENADERGSINSSNYSGDGTSVREAVLASVIPGRAKLVEIPRASVKPPGKPGDQENKGQADKACGHAGKAESMDISSPETAQVDSSARDRRSKNITAALASITRHTRSIGTSLVTKLSPRKTKSSSDDQGDLQGHPPSGQHPYHSEPYSSVSPYAPLHHGGDSIKVKGDEVKGSAGSSGPSPALAYAERCGSSSSSDYVSADEHKESGAEKMAVSGEMASKAEAAREDRGS